MSTPATLTAVRRSWDADAGAYIKAVELADAQQLEPAVAQAINQFVLGCKKDGVWDALKASCILMGARTLSGALTALVGTAPTNTGPFVSGDYNRKTGLIGNGSTKYLVTNRANNADGQNDNHNSVYVTTAPTGNSSHISSDAGVSGQNQMWIGSGTTLTVRHRTTSNNSYSANPTGFIGVSRSASSSYTVRYSGANNTANLTSSSPSSTVLQVFRIPNFGYASNGRLAFYSIGTALTLSLLDTRVSDLYTAIGNAVA